MMIVLALIGLTIVATSYMTRDVRIDQTRAERLANTIYDTIRTARNNMTIGRWVSSGSSLVVTNQREVRITPTKIQTLYNYNFSSTGSENILVSPFFDGDRLYTIKNIAVSSGAIAPDGSLPVWGGSWLTDARIIFDARWDITITSIPSIADTVRLLKITSSYNGFEQSVIFDRVSGVAEIRSSSQD